MKHSFIAAFSCLGLLLLGQAPAHGDSTRVVGTRIFNNGPGWSPEVTITDPDGENQPTRMDGSEVCCQFAGTCLASGGPYNPGDSVTLNTYWNEDMPDPIPTDPWVVNWTLGIRIPNGSVLNLFRDEPIDFGVLDGLGFNPGDVITFCVAGILELPAQCTGGALVTQGHGISFSSGGGTLAVGQSAADDDDSFTCLGACEAGATADICVVNFDGDPSGYSAVTLTTEGCGTTVFEGNYFGTDDDVARDMMNQIDAHPDYNAVLIGDTTVVVDMPGPIDTFSCDHIQEGGVFIDTVEVSTSAPIAVVDIDERGNRNDLDGRTEAFSEFTIDDPFSFPTIYTTTSGETDSLVCSELWFLTTEPYEPVGFTAIWGRFNDITCNSTDPVVGIGCGVVDPSF